MKKKDRASVNAAFKYVIGCRVEQRGINSDLSCCIMSGTSECRLYISNGAQHR